MPIKRDQTHKNEETKTNRPKSDIKSRSYAKNMNENGFIAPLLGSNVNDKIHRYRNKASLARVIGARLRNQFANIQEPEDDEENDFEFFTDSAYYSAEPVEIDFYEDQEIAYVVKRIWDRYREEEIPLNQIPDKVITDMLGSIRVKRNQHNLVFATVAELYGKTVSYEDDYYMTLSQLRVRDEDDEQH
ncbi:hypothetical protein [Paenibacillus sp. MMO-177]|uniref:hypothetical protein n=1 Tax=Paenibacillus sp. MMO-177 TaxID=3081289 RepID=UPI00301A86FE